MNQNRIWCVFAVARETGRLSYLGELRHEKGTYGLKIELAHAASTPWGLQRPYWIASNRRMLATYAEAGIAHLPPATMTFYACPKNYRPDHNPLVLLGHEISGETILLAHTPDVRAVVGAEYVLGHRRTM